MAALTDDLSGDNRPFDPHEVDWTADKVDRFWRLYNADGHGIHFFSAENSQALAELVPAGPMVDIGCGAGDLIAELASRMACVGVDGSPELVEAARRRVPGGQFEVGTATALPVLDGTMASATLIEVVEHLPDDVLSATLREAHRVLRPGGTLVVTTPHREDLAEMSVLCPDCGARFHPIQHVRSWTAEELEQTLRAAGFEHVSVRATKLVRNGGRTFRLARRLWYRLSRPRPHLVATSRRAASYT